MLRTDVSQKVVLRERERMKRMEWRAATIDEVSKIVEHDLRSCGEEQAATFAKYRVNLHLAPLSRYGKEECVVVVARRLDEVIYWEDVEDGFGCSPLDEDGRILQHLCNQNDLCLALRVWTEEDSGRAFHLPDERA